MKPQTDRNIVTIVSELRGLAEDIGVPNFLQYRNEFAVDRLYYHKLDYYEALINYCEYRFLGGKTP